MMRMKEDLSLNCISLLILHNLKFVHVVSVRGKRRRKWGTVGRRGRRNILHISETNFTKEEKEEIHGLIRRRKSFNRIKKEL